MGASPGSVLGAGVVGDIFMLEERGRAMAFFFAVSNFFVHSGILSVISINQACLLGPSTAPFVGGTHFNVFRNVGYPKLT